MISSLIAIVLLALSGVVYFKYYYVFGEGVKAGELNQFVLKGYLFKTYEGKMIQAGIRGGKASGSGAVIESYNLEFSVEDEDVAQQLMELSGEVIKVHYKEYNGVLPWRGNTRYIVDRVVSVIDDMEEKELDTL